MKERIRSFAHRFAFLLWLTAFAACLGLGIAPALAQQNIDATWIPSAAKTATTVNTADQMNCCWRGAVVVLNVSAYTSGTYTLQIQGKDPVSGTYYNLLPGVSSDAVSATGATTYMVYPGLPKTWRIQLQGASTPVMTLSVGGSLLQ